MANSEDALKKLWENFNSAYDLPVIIYHSGALSDRHTREARAKLVQASKNRIWFLVGAGLVEDRHRASMLQSQRSLKNVISSTGSHADRDAK